MSPKIKEENYRTVKLDRLKEVMQLRNVKMKNLAELVGTVYENFQRQVKKESIRKEWVELICDKLNISEEYLSGVTDKKYRRAHDFNKFDKQKEQLKQFMLYSGKKNYDEKIEDLTQKDMQNIQFIIEFAINFPDHFMQFFPKDENI